MKPAKLSNAVQWIAYNDEDGESDLATVENSISVALVADLFGVSTTLVALRVLTLRQERDEQARCGPCGRLFAACRCPESDR